MPKVTPPVVNFNAGELSPLLDSRFDINKYGNGCRTLENFIPMVEGGVKRTPGTYYVLPTKVFTPAKKSRLKAFSFSTEQAYIIEMGDLYFRFFKDDGSGGGQIVIDLSMSAWSASVTYYVGEYTKVGMTVYQCLIANTNKPPATEPTYWSVRTVGNPVEIITTYTEDEVFDLKGPQSADTLYIFHELHPPMKLVRHSHINWELVEFV